MSNLIPLSPLQTLEMFKESHPDLNSIEKILNFSEEDFITTFTNREPFNGDIRKARQAYRAAQRIQEQITLLWANLREIGSPVLKDTLFNNIPETFIKHFNSIPAYNRLFGNLDFIENDPSRSIFGPAAYFVDLLRFIETNITKKNKKNLTIPDGHELEKRHPRLYRIPLDKENTFNLVPYIDLVNEVLEDIVRKPEKSPYQVLEEAKFPMQLPFHLPLEEIRLYLEQLKISLQEIYQLFSIVGQDSFKGLIKNNKELTSEDSKKIFVQLQNQKIIDFRGSLTDGFKPDVNLILSSEYNEFEDQIVEKLKEYQAIKPEIAREILALSPREYQLLGDEITSRKELYAFYGFERKQLFVTSAEKGITDELDNGRFFGKLQSIFKNNQIHLSNQLKVSFNKIDKEWQLEDRQNNQKYVIKQEEEEKTLIVSRDITTTGKGSIEDVDIFIEKTGLTHKQLCDELLFLDLSNEEVNAGLSRLFFINNTGEHQNYLRIEPKVEIERFPMGQGFVKDLDDHHFSEDLKIFFDASGIALSEDTKVLVDEKDHQWRIWDSQQNLTIVIRRTGQQLTVFDEPFDRLENLTPRRLDRIYRFLKLSRKLKWSFAELDWALRSLQKISTGEKVLRFDGVNDYISIPNVRKQDPDPKAFKDTFTLEAWVQPINARINPIFAKGSPDGSFTQFLFYIAPNGKLAFFCNDNVANTQGWGAKLRVENTTGVQNIFQGKDGKLVAINLQDIPTDDQNNKDFGLTLMSDRSIPLDVFTHIAISVNEEKEIDGKIFHQLKFYINGALDSTWSLDKLLPVTALPDVPEAEKEKVQIDINIGKNFLNEFFSGSITEVRLWNAKIVSETDIEKNRFKRLNGRENKLFAYWPLIESLDSQIKNFAIISEQKYNGILGNDSPDENSPNTLPIWVQGDIALDPLPAPLSIHSYHFDGKDQYVGGTVKNLDLDTFTIEAWVTIEESKIHPLLIQGKVNEREIQTQYQLEIDASDKLTFWDATANNTVTLNTPIVIGQKTHIAVVKGSQVEFYINGIKDDSALTSTTTIPNIPTSLENTSILYLGRDFADNYLKGLLQEVRIWNTAKIPKEDRHHQLAGSEEGLVGYWRLDEPNPYLSLAHDRTINNNHLSPGGIAEVHQPQAIDHDGEILPNPVVSKAPTLTFGANQYPIIVYNENLQGLGHFEQFTLQFWFKADNLQAAHRQILFTQGDQYVGLTIYLFEEKLHAYAWRKNLAGEQIKDLPLNQGDEIQPEQWHHLTLTYDETVERELIATPPKTEISEEHPPKTEISEEQWKIILELEESGKTLAQQISKSSATDFKKLQEDFKKLQEDFKKMKFKDAEEKDLVLTEDSKAIKVWIDSPNKKWRIRDYFHGKTYLLRRQGDRLKLYEITLHPKNEVAYKLYLDGNLIAKTEEGFRLDQVGNAYLGNKPSHITIQFDGVEVTSEDTHHLEGQITDFRLWKTTILEENIKNLYKRHTPPDLKQEDLICYLPMTEGYGRSVSNHIGPSYQDENKGFGPEIPDQSPNNHIGQLSVGPDTPDWKPTNDLPLFRDRVLKLNGTDQYVLLPYTSDLNLIDSNFTIETWIRVESLAKEMPIIGSDSPKEASDNVTRNQGLYLLVTEQGHIRAGLYGDHVTSQQALTPQKWHHIAWRYDKQTKIQTLFIDRQSQPNSPSQGLHSDIPLYLGRRRVIGGVESFFAGEIAELRIWRVSRTDTEIQAHWNQELTGKEENLESYWIFDRDPRSVLMDRSTSHHRAVIEPSSSLDEKWIDSTTPFRRQFLALQFNTKVDRPIDFIDLSPLTLTEKGTIELWMQFSRNSDQILFDASTIPQYGNVPFLIDVCDRKLSFRVGDNSGMSVMAQIDLQDFSTNFGVTDFEYDFYLLEIAKQLKLQIAELLQLKLQIAELLQLNDQLHDRHLKLFRSFRLLYFYFHTLIQQRQDFDTEFHHIVAKWEFDPTTAKTWVQLTLDGFSKHSAQKQGNKGNGEKPTFSTPYIGLNRTSDRLDEPTQIPGTRYFQGQIRQIRIWNRILERQELQRLENADLEGKEEGLSLCVVAIEENIVSQNLLFYAPTTNRHGVEPIITRLKDVVSGSTIAISRLAIPDPTPHWVDIDKAVELDGNNDFIHLPHYEPTESGTIELWTKFSCDRNQILLDASNDEPQNSSLQQKFFLLEVCDRKLRFGIEDTTDLNCVVEMDLSDVQVNFFSQWHHLAVAWRYDRTNQGMTVQIFLDGHCMEENQFEASENWLSNILHQGLSPKLYGIKPNFKSLYIGVRRGNYYPWQKNNQPYPFQGHIAQVRIWDHIRSLEELQNLRNVPLQGTEAGLLVYLPIEEGNGLNLNNHPPSSQVGFLFIGEECESNHKWVTLDRGVQLNGIDEFIELPEYIPHNQGTIEIWGQFPRFRDQIIFDASKDDNNCFILEIQDGYLLFRLKPLTGETGNTHDRSDQIDLTCLPNEFDRGWHHIAVSWHSNIEQEKIYFHLYLDETYHVEGDFPLFDEPLEQSLKNLYFGIRRNQNKTPQEDLALAGIISQVRIWNDVLSHKDLRRWRYANLDGSETGLLYCLLIDEKGTGTSLRNQSAGGHAILKTGGSPTPTWLWQKPKLFHFEKDSVVLPKTQDLNINNSDFTLEAWIWLEDLENEYPIVGIRESRNPKQQDEEQFVLSVNRKGQVVVRMLGTKKLVVDTINLAAQQWYQIVCQYSASDRKLTLKVLRRHHAHTKYNLENNFLFIPVDIPDFLNYFRQRKDVRPYQAHRRLYIGFWRSWNSEGVESKYFRGFIDEVRFWKGVRTSEELQQHQERRLRGDEENLLAYWTLLEDSHHTLHALGAQQHQARLFDQITQIGNLYPLLNQDLPPIHLPHFVPELDGYNDYVAFGETFFTEGQSYTIELWFKETSETSQWHHFAAVYEGNPTPTQIFIDGEAVPVTLENLPPVLRAFTIDIEASEHPEAFFTGQIAEFRLWNKVRTPEEIRALRQHRLTGREQDLWAYWPINERQGTDLQDESETLDLAEWIVGLENTDDKWKKLPPSKLEESLFVPDIETKPLSALYLDGKDDFIKLLDSKDDFNKPLFITDLKLNGDFTVEAWLKIEESDSDLIEQNGSKAVVMPILGSKSTSSANQPVLCLGVIDKKPYLSFGNDNKLKLIANWQLDQDWHHLTWQYDSKTKTMRILIDGQQIAQESGQEPFTGQGEARIGYCQEWNGSGQFDEHYFKGGISELRVWQTVRTQKEIQENYKRRLPWTEAIPEQLVAYWIFDDSNYTIIPSRKVDDDNPYRSIIHSDQKRQQPVWQAINNHPVRVKSLPQQAFQFDGQGQYLATDELQLFPSAFTLEAWIKAEEKDRPLFWWQNETPTTTDNTQFEIRISPSGEIELLDQSEVLLAFTAENEIKVDVFTHIAIAIEHPLGQEQSAIVTILIDGEEKGRTQLQKQIFTPQGVLQVGRSDLPATPTHFKGLIQEVRLWKGVRSKEDLQANLHQPLQSISGDLLAYWSLTEIVEEQHSQYAPNQVKNSPALRLGGLIESRKPTGGEPTEFLDARRRVLTLPLPKKATKELTMPKFEVEPRDRAQRTIEVWFQCENPFLADRQIVYEEKHRDPNLDSVSFAVFNLFLRHKNGDLLSYLVLYQFLIYRRLTIFVQSGRLYFEIYNRLESKEKRPEHLNQLVVSRISTDRIQTKHWHHVALVLDAREEVRDNAIYALLDGQMIDAQPAFQLWGKPESILIGGLPFSLPITELKPTKISHTIDPLLGQIKEVRVWDRVRTIEQLRDDRFKRPEQKPLFHWETETLDKRFTAPMQLPTPTETNISDPRIPLMDLAHLQQLQTKSNDSKQSIARLATLWTEIKHTGIAADQPTLFNAIFNPKGTPASKYWSYGQRIRWEIKSNELTQCQIRSRLMKSLNPCSFEELELMVRTLSGEVDTVILDGSYLSELYRLRFLATMLKLPIKDVIKLIALLRREYQGSATPFNDITQFTIQDVLKLKAFADWMNQTGIDLSEYDFLVNDREDRRVSVPYKDSGVFEMAVALLNQCREHLLSPTGLKTDSISEAASVEVYKQLKIDGSINEITLQLPSENNNSDAIANFGVVQPNFTGFNALSSDNYLELIARNSNWKEAFQGLILSQTILRRKAYVLSSINSDPTFVDELNQGKLPKHLADTFRKPLKEDKSITSRVWLITDDQNHQYWIELNEHGVFHIKPINIKLDNPDEKILPFSIDPHFDNPHLKNGLNQKRVSEDLRKFLTHNNINLSEQPLVEITEWSIVDEEDKDKKKVYLIVKDGKQLKVYQVESEKLQSIFDLESNLSGEFSQIIISKELRTQFFSHEIQLSPKASIKSIGWKITDSEKSANEETTQIIYEIKHGNDGVFSINSSGLTEPIKFNLAFELQLNQQQLSSDLLAFFKQNKAPLTSSRTVHTKEWELSELFHKEEQNKKRSYTISHIIAPNPDKKNELIEKLTIYGGWIDDLGRAIIEEVLLFNIEGDFKDKLEKDTQELSKLTPNSAEQKAKLREIAEKLRIYFLREKYSLSTEIDIQEKWRIQDGDRIYLLQKTKDNHLGIYESDPHGKSLLFSTFPSLVEMLNQGTRPDELFDQKDYPLSSKAILEKEWLIIDQVQQTTYTIRHNSRQNQLNVFDIQDPEELGLKKLQEAYGNVAPEPSKEKLLEVRDKLLSQQKLQASLLPYITNTLVSLQLGLFSTIVDASANLLQTNPDRLKLIIESTKENDIQGEIYGKGLLNAEKFLLEINKVALAINKDLALLASPDLARDLTQWSKILFLLSQFALSDFEIEVLLKRPLVFNLMPLGLLNPSQTDLTILYTFVKLKNSLNVTRNVTDELIRVLDKEKELNPLTNWTDAELNVVRKRLNIEVDSLAILDIDRLSQAFHLIQILGTDASYLVELSNIYKPKSESQDFDRYQRHAEILFNLVGAKCDSEQWPSVYKPIHADLAVKKRDGLTAFAMEELSDKIQNRKSPDLLYEYLLIDVQTGSEVNTSRIVQAIASLQLYIQRCLMDLEKDVKPESVLLKEWEWMKNYRVWEANRKVFLYPENYIEPELRDTKTPEFEALQEELLQDEITQDTVERAIIHYLDKFKELANLKIVGSYLHKEFDPQDKTKVIGDTILYLVGRTESQPKIYYYREYIVNKDRWLPWKKIDLSINSDFVSPVYAFNKLFIFWVDLAKSTKSFGEGNQRINIDVYKPTVKYSYYNFDKTWIVPQTYQEVQTELFEHQIDQIKWKKVFVQRSSNSQKFQLTGARPNNHQRVKVIIVSKSTDISRNIPQFNMENLTWSFWLKIESTVTEAMLTFAEGELQESALLKMKKTLTIFEYNNSAVVKATITNTHAQAFERLSDIKQLEEKVKEEKRKVSEIEQEIITLQEQIADTQIKIGTFPLEISGIQLRISSLLIREFNAKFRLNNAVPGSGEAQSAEAELKSVTEALKQADEELKKTENNLKATIADNVKAKTDLKDAEQKRLPVAQKNLDEAMENLKIALNKPQWRVKNPQFSFQLGSGNSIETSKLPYGQWCYIAIVLERNVSTYNAKLSVFDQGDPKTPNLTPIESLSKSFTIDILLPEKLLSIGQVDTGDVEDAFTAQMSEFQLWKNARSDEKIALERYQRQENSEQFRLGLDGKEGVISVANSTLQLKNISESINIEKRDRVLIFYGTEGYTMRDSLNKENDFKIVHKATNNPEYDVILNPVNPSNNSRFQLSVTHDDGLRNFDAYSVKEEVNSINQYINLLHRQRYLPDIIAKSPFEFSRFKLEFDEININLAKMEMEPIIQFWKNNVLLSNLKPNEISLIDVGNQPGWYLLDTGNEQFLIRANNDRIETLEQRLTSPMNPDISSDDQQTNLPLPSLFAELTLLPDPELAFINSTDNSPTFEFKRLNTFAIHQISLSLFEKGVDGLLSIKSQESTELNFKESYQPIGSLVIPPPAKTDSKGNSLFDFEGANGLYYKEIFLHIPFLIANQLNANQRFAEAQKWYHYIFNPTAQEADDSVSNTKDRYWRYRPFRNQSLETFSEMLSNTEALKEYREDPFDPHTIANLRLNTYQKAVVMKYIDNLIDWGDYLFRQDTRESINEAILLYVLAFNLLGPIPKAKPERKLEPMGNFQDIQADLEQNNISELPDFLIPSSEKNLNDKVEIPFDPNRSVITRFSVPENAQFMGYWDRVEDRLYKIRHSLNIDGVFRELDLFQPPIDPAVLVRAVAGGGLAGGISAALASLNMPVPHYRYSFMLEKAKEMNRQAIELGGALLQALEKKDAEELLLLQHTHELNIMNRMTEVKQLQIQEIEINLESLKASLESAQDRKKHYEGLIDDGVSTKELAQVVLMGTANILSATGVVLSNLGGVVSTVVPDIIGGGAGTMGSPVLLYLQGGTKTSEGQSKVATGFQMGAEIANTAGQIAGLFANYERREQDWDLQKTIAEHDIVQIEQQIAATAIQIKIASRELQIHELTITQHKEVGDFYRSKFTNKELYTWMISRLSGLYFQTYKLAYDLAKKAEKAYQYEFGTDDTFIDFGHWDSRRKGLLAGEGLRLDLARLEKAALDQHVRYLEVTKHISLSRLDPIAFLQLKETDRCQFGLGELLFDRDFPGHYFRIIKSVSISIPAVIGPYQTFRATLTQTSNKTLLAPDIDGVRYLMGDGDQSPTTIRAGFRANQQIAISTGVEDSGMFELNFGDGRYLPFEGTGVVSTWLLEMPKATNPIDFNTITDVIIHVRYTSKADGGRFKQEVMELESFKAYEGVRLLSLAHDFPTQWNAFKNNSSSSQTFPITSNIFPPNVNVEEGFTILRAYTVKEDGMLDENLLKADFSESEQNQIKIEGDKNQKEQAKNLLVLLSYSGELKT